MPPQRLPAELLVALGLAGCSKLGPCLDFATGPCLDFAVETGDTGDTGDTHDSGPCLDVVDSGDSSDTGGDSGNSAARGPTTALVDRITQAADLPPDIAARLRKRCSDQ